MVALVGVGYASGLIGGSSSSASYEQTSYPTDTPYSPPSESYTTPDGSPPEVVPIPVGDSAYQPASDANSVQPLTDGSSSWTDPSMGAAPAWQDPNPPASQLEINPFEPPVSSDSPTVN